MDILGYIIVGVFASIILFVVFTCPNPENDDVDWWE